METVLSHRSSTRLLCDQLILFSCSYLVFLLDHQSIGRSIDRSISIFISISIYIHTCCSVIIWSKFSLSITRYLVRVVFSCLSLCCSKCASFCCKLAAFGQFVCLGPEAPICIVLSAQHGHFSAPHHVFFGTRFFAHNCAD